MIKVAAGIQVAEHSSAVKSLMAKLVAEAKARMSQLQTAPMPAPKSRFDSSLFFKPGDLDASKARLLKPAHVVSGIFVKLG